jgi:hypothetical protein
LQLVVNNDAGHGHRVPINVAAAGKVCGYSGQRHGVRPTTAGHEYPRRISGFGQGVLQQPARFADDRSQTAGPASSFTRQDSR